MTEQQIPYAPGRPALDVLEARHPLSVEAEANIVLGRERVNDMLRGTIAGVVGLIGPCAMTGARSIIEREGDTDTALTSAHEGLYIVHRMPPWKPRSNVRDWHGLETTEPEQAYATLIGQANRLDAVAIELADHSHLTRYEKALTLGWFGGRNVGKADFMRKVATNHPTLPLAVKNGLSGEVEPALRLADELQASRGDDEGAAVLLYRGGENATNPQTWEIQYRKALELTAGRLIVDVAHGSEMAHHPAGTFKKSVPGQIAALQHVLDIAEQYGEMPVAVMSEASQAYSPTDPHMPHNIALQGVRRLHELRMHQNTSLAV
jgi:phospho-2-dehydro-3-deoxyheptonate aldolase